ncbi:hypothetical protein AB0H76_15020 [Nocardia sp. NPDC050712]|uniref:hypothetical protein n=1 Tax=Nocardia sp. NPDC050712 TaxID=3155518 RepID=UPI0033F77D90
MSTAKRPPIIRDGIAIDPDWLDAQVANYRPGCMDAAVRMMRAFERSDRRRAQESAQRGAA